MTLFMSDDAFSIEANISTAAPNNKAGVYTESPNNAALRFGIRFTTAQFHETKLLKLLSDANAPHFLYKKVIEWEALRNMTNIILIPPAPCGPHR